MGRGNGSGDYITGSFMVYSNHQISRMLKSGRMRWTGNVACMEIREVHRALWWGKPKERYDLKDLDVDGTIILKLILTPYHVAMDWIYLARVRDRW
jgi:hypothetical protein